MICSNGSMSIQQQLPPFYSAAAAGTLETAANSQSSADGGSSSSGIGSSLAAFSFSSSSSRSPLSDSASTGAASSSSSGSSGCGGEEDAEWCLGDTRRATRSRRSSGSRRPRARAQSQRQPLGGGGSSTRGNVAKKMMKNAREKERVKHVREQYEALDGLLGSRVERGSGHFSKVRILGTAIRRVKGLKRELGDEEDEPPYSLRREDEQPTAAIQPSPPLPPPHSPSINLNCDERLEVEPGDVHQTAAPPNSSFDSFFHEEIVPSYAAEVPPDDLPPAYFTYNAGAEFPPVLGSPCLFSYPGGSPGPSTTLPPPSSSLVYSPEIAPGHISGGAPGSIGVLSPLGVSPPPQHPYHCGSDVWMAIGCN